MSAGLLLADLLARGVRLTAAGERLVVDAPKGVVTDDLRQLITIHKLELLSLLEDDPRPTRPCHPCRSKNWRRRPPERGRGWLCAACYPDLEQPRVTVEGRP